ncbi:MAG TPA: MFS transporter [Bryobacteraceae bacterium]|nr:MFS transporter [Bryobacteraceae bacterium]
MTPTPAQTRWLTAAADAGMFVFGIVMALLGAILPILSARLHFDLAQAGDLFFAMNCAMLVSMLVLGWVMDRFGKRLPMVLGPLLVALALWLIAAAASYSTLAVSLALLGFGGGALNGAANTLVADLHSDPRRKSAALNLLGVFFGFGAVFLPFTIGALLESLGLVPILYAALALTLVPLILSLMLPFPAARHERGLPFADVLRLARTPLVLTFAFLLFFESGNEFIIGGFTSSYLTRELHSSISAASYLLAVYWITLMLARVALSRLMLKLKPAAVILASALIAALGLAVLAAVHSEGAAAAALILAGLGVASIYPTTLGLAGTRFEEYSGTVFGILFAVALVGGMSLPWALGQIGAARGLRTALALPVAAFLAIFLLQTVISRKLAARRPALKLIALLLLAAAAARAADFLPVAVWYGGGKARAPMLEPDPQSKKELWRRDLRQIRALGFNAIRCWIDWASAEPAEGRYRFDTIDVLLELARKEGLKVIIQTYMDAAPDWVGRKFPDSFYVAASGEVMRPESAPGYCVDHPGVRRAEEAFFTALARRAAQSPAFLGWDLWSEPHVINWATANYLLHPEFCFCPSSIRRFRAWLQHKYASLEALNQAWYRQFTSWDQVEPGRLSTILSYTDYIDWRNFIQQKLGEDLRLRYEAVKRGAPDRIATSHAAIPSLFTSPLAGDGSPDDWIMARQVDFYGTSFYPKHSRPVGYDVAWRAALLDFERSSAFSPQGHGGFWIGELQAGFGTVALNVSATVTADDLRDWTWSALSRGAKGINFYAWYPMSTGYESGGYGLIQLDGTLTARSRVAGEIARVVDRHQRLFLDARPPKAHVAIIFNPLSYMIGGRQRAATTAGPQSEVGSIERDSWLGAYRALFPTNVPVDFLHAGELSAALLAQYKLVLFPYPLMIPEKAGALLREYVRAGGTLVSEARLAWTSETGRASETIPGLGLFEVTGCRETDVHSVPGLRTELRWTDAAIPGVRPGDRLAARVYEETLEPAGLRARAVAVFPSGAPAAVLSAFGRGRTLTLGSYLAVAYEAQKDPAVARFFAGLLEWAGVERPVEVAEGEAEVRFLESGAERLVFVFNHADQATTPRITLHLPATRATDLLTGQPVPLSAPALTLRKMLAPHEVWILRIL